MTRLDYLMDILAMVILIATLYAFLVFGAVIESGMP